MKNSKTEINATEIDTEELANVRGGHMPLDIRKILEIIRKFTPSLRLPSTPPPGIY